MDAIFKIGLFIHRNKILIHVKFRMKCFLPNLEVAIPSRKWDLFLSVFCGDISCNTFLLCVNYLRLDDWAKGEQWMWEVWEPPVRDDGSEELEGGKHFSLDGVDAFLKTPLSAKGRSRREYCCQPKKIELRFHSENIRVLCFGSVRRKPRVFAEVWGSCSHWHQRTFDTL